MMGRLTTHVLDTLRGRPAQGIRIELFRLAGARWDALAVAVTNADGRTDGPLLSGDGLVAGKYRIEFHVADYFRSVGAEDAGKFLDVVPVEFIVADAVAAYHVPLLVSPWHYVTYRGS
jgi:5-hydroxyisourate hydrolase